MGMVTLESLSAWGIANGLGAHTRELSEDELKVQLKVKTQARKASIPCADTLAAHFVPL